MKYEENKYEEELVSDADTQNKQPALYQVIVHNDDFTPMEFVMAVLERFFFMDRSRAADVTMTAHMNGKAACGVFTKDVAASKISQVIDFARMHDQPLVCSMESASS